MSWQEFGPRANINFHHDAAVGDVPMPPDRWRYVEAYGGMREALRALEAGGIAVLNSVGVNPGTGEVELRTKGQHFLDNLTRLGIQGKCFFWDSADGVEQGIHKQVRDEIAQGRLSALLETSAIAWGKIYAVFSSEELVFEKQLPNPRASFSLTQWQGGALCNGHDDGVEWYGGDNPVRLPRIGTAMASDNNILAVRASSGFIVSPGPKGRLLGKRDGVEVVKSSNKPKEAGIDVVEEARSFAALTADPEIILTTSSSVAIWLFPDGKPPFRVTVTTFLPVGRVDWAGVEDKLAHHLTEAEQIKIRNVPGGLALTDVLRQQATSMKAFPRHFKVYKDTVFCFRTLWPPALSVVLRDKEAEKVLRQTHNMAIYRDRIRNEVQVYLQDIELSNYWR